MYFWNTGFWNYPVGWHCMVLIKSMQMAKAIKFLCGFLLILWLANGECILFYHPALQLQHVKGCAGEETQDLHASSCLWLHMWKKGSALSSKSKVLHIGASWKWSGPYQVWKWSKHNLRWTTHEVLHCVFNYLTKKLTQCRSKVWKAKYMQYCFHFNICIKNKDKNCGSLLQRLQLSLFNHLFIIFGS